MGTALLGSHGNVPELPPTLRPGRSAMSWTRIQLKATVLMVLVGIAWPLIAVWGLDPFTRTVLLSFDFVIGIGLGVGGGIFATLKKGEALRREIAAGYTTLYGRAYDYWQLDPKTGEVLRRPGEREAAKRRRA